MPYDGSNQIQDLLSIIKDNEIDDKDKWSRNVAEFYPVRSHLSCQGNVVFYKDRIVIPTSLRSLVLNNLHSGHSGVSSMMMRAADLSQDSHSCLVFSRLAWIPGHQ